MRSARIAAVVLAAVILCQGAAYAEQKNDAPAVTTPPADTSVQTYTSKHGFKINYPKSWVLETYLEGYGTLKEAYTDGGNYFAIQSFRSDDPRIESFHFFPADTLKMEVWIFPDEKATLAQIVTGTKGIIKVDDFTIDGKKAKKVWQALDEGVPGEDVIYSIYFVDAGKRAVFTCYPTYTNLTGEFEKIVGSFRFE